jgi:medium-chain acyl-[acyl-carrier-protein] hydrolase
MAMDGQSNPWFLFPARKPNASVRLFCFPYAGGSAHIFYQWPALLPDFVELVAIQLPGRGPRIVETPFQTVSEIVEALMVQIVPLLDRPYMMFGHSLGATISFELLRLLRKKQQRSATAFFPAGRHAPHMPDSDPPTAHLSDVMFISELKRLNGTPQEILQNNELMQLVLPVLRADFKAAESYRYTDEPALAIPFTVFGGEQDEGSSTEKEMKEWRQHTTSDFSTKLLSGDHFFLHENEEKLLKELAVEIIKFKE